ncbi:hypothetical protein ACIQ1S_09335 [Streptomyces griseus]|uniref:hypothetical protein n=1 Tax=Streptomyces griseus TaxID=1911 RepID=UPI00382C0348
MRKIAAALDAMTEITKNYGVALNPYGSQQIGLDDNVISVSWDGSAYFIDDRNGD